MGICQGTPERVDEDVMLVVYVHEMLHALGFDNIMEDRIGDGPNTLRAARELFGCASLDAAPVLSGSPHWDASMVGGNEVRVLPDTSLARACEPTACTGDPCSPSQVMSVRACKGLYISDLTLAAMSDTGRFSVRGRGDAWRGGHGCEGANDSVRYPVPYDCPVEKTNRSNPHAPGVEAKGGTFVSRRFMGLILAGVASASAAGLCALECYLRHRYPVQDKA